VRGIRAPGQTGAKGWRQNARGVETGEGSASSIKSLVRKSESWGGGVEEGLGNRNLRRRVPGTFGRDVEVARGKKKSRTSSTLKKEGGGRGTTCIRGGDATRDPRRRGETRRGPVWDGRRTPGLGRRKSEVAKTRRSVQTRPERCGRGTDPVGNWTQVKKTCTGRRT